MALEQVHRMGRRRPVFSTPSRRRRMRVGIVVGLFLGFVALAWAWAFQRGPSTPGADVPVLAADPQPTRERPTDPGGMKVADIDPLAYDSGRSPPRVENILPAPEKPLPQPVAETHAATPVSQAPAPASNDAPAVAASTPAAKPVQTAQADTSAPPMKPVAEVSPPPSKAVTNVVRQAAVAPPPKPKPVAAREEAKPKPKSMPVESGSYRLQLASLRSAADARSTEERLRRSYGEVLGAVNFSVVSVDLGDRGKYYRVMAGPMSQGSASQICDSLRQRGAACLLAKP